MSNIRLRWTTAARLKRSCLRLFGIEAEPKIVMGELLSRCCVQWHRHKDTLFGNPPNGRSQAADQYRECFKVALLCQLDLGGIRKPDAPWLKTPNRSCWRSGGQSYLLDNKRQR